MISYSFLWNLFSNVDFIESNPKSGIVSTDKELRELKKLVLLDLLNMNIDFRLSSGESHSSKLNFFNMRDVLRFSWSSASLEEF